MSDSGPAVESEETVKDALLGAADGERVARNEHQERVTCPNT
jgi:hypothetical protein